MTIGDDIFKQNKINYDIYKILYKQNNITGKMVDYIEELEIRIKKLENKIKKNE